MTRLLRIAHNIASWFPANPISIRVSSWYFKHRESEKAIERWAAEFAKITKAEADAVRYHEEPWICLAGDGSVSDVDPADWDLHGDIDYPSSRDGAS